MSRVWKDPTISVLGNIAAACISCGVEREFGTSEQWIIEFYSMQDGILPRKCNFTKIYCAECHNEKISQVSKRRLAVAQGLILRIVNAQNRGGWEEGENETEVMTDVSDYLANEDIDPGIEEHEEKRNHCIAVSKI